MLNFATDHTQLLVSADGAARWQIGAPILVNDQAARFEGSAWGEVDSNTLSSDHDLFSCRVTFALAAENCLSCRIAVTFRQPVTVYSLSLPVQIAARDLHYLDRAFRWKSWRAADVLDGLTPTCLSGTAGDRTASVQFMRHGLVDLLAPGRCDLYLDHARIHPRLFYTSGTAARYDNFEAAPGRTLEARAAFTLYPDLRQGQPGPVLWRYPAGKQACFAITDHADWDTAEKMAALFLDPGGINHTPLRITKSVFWGTVGRELSGKTLHPDGLDVPAYAAIMDQLHQAGHEIAPHSIVVRPTSSERIISSEMVEQALTDFSTHYQSGTWIDHGTARGQAINYSQLGWSAQSEWYLVDRLKRHRFNNLWSYYDTLDQPVKNINQLAPPDGSAAYLAAAGRDLISGRLWAALNYFKFALALRLGERGQKQLGLLVLTIKNAISRELTPEARRKRLSHLISRVPRALLSLPYFLLAGRSRAETARDPLYATVYAEPALPLAQAEDSDLVMFASSAVTNLYTAWQPRHLDRLVREHGLHLAHTYFSSTLTYAEPAVIHESGGWKIAPRFARLLAEIGPRIENGQLWNPTMRECAAWFKTWVKLEVVPVGPQEIEITNPTAQPVKDCGLRFPLGTAAVYAGDVALRSAPGDPLIYLIDLDPGQTVRLRW